MDSVLEHPLESCKSLQCPVGGLDADGRCDPQFHNLTAFGDPVAVTHDLAGADGKAVEACRQRAILGLFCQYRFLAAAGHKLLDGGYLIGNQFHQLRVRFVWSAESP